jgi:hypothetical protein
MEDLPHHTPEILHCRGSRATHAQAIAWSSRPCPQPATLDSVDLGVLMRQQEGVLARRQVLEAGLDDLHIARMVRRREWARVFQGVYVDHTGSLSWLQRAWAATLLHEPAALSGGSALRAHGLAIGSADDDIELVIPSHRRVDDPPGVRTSRARGFAEIVHPSLRPSRLRVEPAALMVASRVSSEDAAVAVLSDVCQQGRTTPARLLAALDTRPRLARRRLLRSVLDDVASGSYSALERRYLTRVERAHGLPTGARQRRVRPGRTVHYRDVEYVGLGTVVELDGRLGHESARDRWLDLDRDLSSLLIGDLTVRLGWGQVLEPCRTAVSIGRLLVARGWPGRPRDCGPDCPA